MDGLPYYIAPAPFNQFYLAGFSSPSRHYHCSSPFHCEAPSKPPFYLYQSMYEPSEKAIPYLPRSLQISHLTGLPPLPNATMNGPGLSRRDFRPSSPSMTSGIEVVKPTAPKMLKGETDLLTQRQEGMQRTKDIIYEQIANNQFPMEESENVVRFLEKRADECVQQTYHDGKRVNEVSDTLMVPRVGLTLLAGADTPQVNRMEQVGMNNKAPEQKSAAWRVNTAGTLLNDFEVDSDLSIIQSDNTSQVVARLRERNLLTGRAYAGANSAKHVWMTKPRNERTVTIHSDHVKIVKDLAAESWDLESTLIEVDGSSLTNLIVNYRHLISRGGPALTFPETIKLLDVMIEDARRLYIRSPILFRMSTRRHMMLSKNTRYGIDHGLMFRTLTTSRGIKNIISLSASYFNALATSGNKDRSQELIRPKFLQMLVLLLSLLNDEDLSDLKEFLETTYRIKADRQSLEILILKVLPLMSINSKIFIQALVAAVEKSDVDPDLDMNHQGKIWNNFVQRLLRLGYVLPGTVAQLGQTGLSWIIIWPEDGIKDSHVFRNLQFSGTYRTMNEIPSLLLDLESSLEEVTIVVTSGDKFVIAHDDLEKIICMTPGRYPMTEAVAQGQCHDLEINEVVVNSTLYEAIFRLNRIIAEYNSYLAIPRQRGSVLTKLSALRERSDTIPLKEIKGSGRLTRNVAKLNNQILAVAYKVEGRKITRRDLLRNLSSDIRTVNAVTRVLETAMQDYDHRNTSANIRSMINQRGRALAKIRSQIAQADTNRTRLANRDRGDLSDEPISRVLYPSGSNNIKVPVWHEYRAWYVMTENTLVMEAHRKIVERVRWMTDDVVEIGFHGSSANYLLSPLAAVAEHERTDEIRPNDAIVLVGQYVMVVELGEGESSQGQEKESITNWLRIVEIEQCPLSRRGMNRTSNASKVLARWTFR